ncbi:MAG: hypothetical protein CFE26_08100 [Verrucomicrobiales bacterium VVV1]|nr:MAG: hypothetical protein CFE26_08100 [Verrucomicrobiales bacterium VVV1]
MKADQLNVRMAWAAIATLLGVGSLVAQSPPSDSQKSGAAGKHLFILAGQSNMTDGLKAGFTKIVDQAFTRENVTIAHQCKPGRGIRFWDKDFKYPAGFQFADQSKPSNNDKQHGELYPPLLETILTATKGNSYGSVTLVWMQGESDGLRGLGDAYEPSFLRLLERLKSDLNRKDIHFVIGRISDANMDQPGWIKVREVQKKLAEDHEHCGWIDTDDLNGGEAGKPGGDLHYPKDQIGIVGERLATKAVELIQKNP